MPTWTWILIAVMVVVAAVVLFAALAVGRRKRRDRLKERFGPEYERTVTAAGGQGAAEKELAERERRHDELDIVELSDAALQQYAGRWRSVQTAFVDDPSSAVGQADALVTEVMRERGYPIDDFDRRAADISVDHPTVVENYRGAHEIHRRGDVGTEEQRQAFVHYRALFEKLLEPNTAPRHSRHTDTTQETPA